MKTSQSGSAHIIILSIISILVIGVIGFLFWKNFVGTGPDKPSAEVGSYSECVKTKGSIIQESFPEVCVVNGKSFTNTSQSVASQPKSYCAPIEKICFDYPSEWSLKSAQVSQENDGIAERIVVSDQDGKPWLKLETGLTGVGGACGNDDGSYVKILRTHTTNIQGDYLVGEASAPYADNVAYAVGWAVYSGTNKSWAVDMELSTAKATHSVAKIDACDTGLGIINGKNAKIDPSLDGKGALTFKYYLGSGATSPVYASEAEASAALMSPGAMQAYDILKSAHYE